MRAVRSLLAPGEIYGLDQAGRAELQIWWYLWRALAEECPGAFLPDARRLQHESPGSLVFAYARRREPTTIPRLRLRQHERRSLDRARRALHEITGLEGLKRPCRIWMIDPKSLVFRGRAAFTGAEAAHCIASDPAVRREVIVHGEYVRAYREHPEDFYLPLAILHEEVHAAIAESCTWAENDPLTRPLVQRLQEPAAVLCELHAEHLLLHGHEPKGVNQLRRITREHPDGARARALLSLIPPDADVDDGLRLAVRIAQLGLSSDSDEQLRGSLNEITGRRRSLARWLSSFG